MNKRIFWTFLVLTVAMGMAAGVSATTREDFPKDNQDVYVPVINYHMFDQTSKHPSVNVTPKDFREQMLHLKEMGYTAITSSEYEAYLKGESYLPPKPIMITIDDGYKSVYDTAYPVLKELGMKATLFVITSHVESGERLGLPMSSWSQLKEMSDSGVIEIGNHTHDLHYRLQEQAGREALIMNLDRKGKKLSRQQRKQTIINDLKHAEKLIFDNVGVETRAFAYPYGAYDWVAEEAVREAGITMAYTTENGINTKDTYPLQIKRMNGSSYREPFYYSDAIAQHEAALALRGEGRASVYERNGTYHAMAFIEGDPYSDHTQMKEARFELWQGEKFIRTFSPKYRNFTDRNMTVRVKDAQMKSGSYNLKVIIVREDLTKEVVWKQINVK